MKKLKRTTLTTFVLLGLFVSSGVAIADPVETEVNEEEATVSAVLADTLFSFGYDLINGLLLWNISSIDEPCDPELDCELTGGEVAGPNGQINHGMFIKLFNSLYDGTGRGCVVRHLAESDLGKVDDETEAETVEFTTVETVCQHGPGNGDELESEDDGRGKPASAGKPEGVGKPDSPDKSGSAPGKNK